VEDIKVQITGVLISP